MFSRKKKQEMPQYDLEKYEPVIRSSICTGEKVACMQDRENGRMHEVMLIRTAEDLSEFCRLYGCNQESIRTVY